jgi:hypothetical protein
MKKILIFTVLTILSFLLQGQEYSYVPYVQDGNFWSYAIPGAITTTFEDANPSPGFVSYAITADTICVGSNCYKRTFYGCDDYHIYFGALREQDQKVYFIIGNEERLVYDFSLKIGDTFLALDWSDTNIIVVSDIDTIQINGGYRKIFYFGDSETDNFWIEGIGSVNHATDPFAIKAEKSYYGLNYKKENGEIVYHSTEAWYNKDDCRSLIIENIAQHQSNALLQNSPNPFNKSTTIRYQLAENTKNAKICIYNLQGKQLQCHPLKSASGEIEVKASALRSGTYLYSLIINNKLIETKRMILTE